LLRGVEVKWSIPTTLGKNRNVMIATDTQIIKKK